VILLHDDEYHNIDTTEHTSNEAPLYQWLRLDERTPRQWS